MHSISTSSDIATEAQELIISTLRKEIEFAKNRLSLEAIVADDDDDDAEGISQKICIHINS
jgi:hypothetical protein